MLKGSSKKHLDPSELLSHGIQVAQLSQRDRAAGWVSNGQKWKTGTERNIYGQYRSILNHCDVFSQQINRNRRKNAKCLKFEQ